jgi:hypothetical protein
MKYKREIIIIIDSIIDDYYFLWECFYDYKESIKINSEKRLLVSFSEALIEAYENKLFNFFRGKNFDGDEVLISEFSLSNSIIADLVNWDNESMLEIRITASDLGIAFIEQNMN